MNALKNGEVVVLVDEQNNPLGVEDKYAVHTSQTPLHRGFSVFLFNSSGDVLLQQRSLYKKTWPLAWSGSCCGHPFLGETTEAAVRRRVQYELGIKEIGDLTEMLPLFRYQCIREGIMENEICPVWVGTVTTPIEPNFKEVAEYEWKSWALLSHIIDETPGAYSEWCGLEVRQLNKLPEFVTYLNRS